MTTSAQIRSSANNVTADNLTRVDPAPGAGPDPDRGPEDGLSGGEDQDHVFDLCQSDVCLAHSSCLTLLYQRKTDICSLVP